MSALTAQRDSDGEYRCHLCNSALVFHRKTTHSKPWFAHADAGLSAHGREHCPYVNVALTEVAIVKALRAFVPKARPLVQKAHWHCSSCDNAYYGEKYCLTLSMWRSQSDYRYWLKQETTYRITLPVLFI